MVYRDVNPNLHVYRCRAKAAGIQWKEVLVSLEACEMYSTSTPYLETGNVQRGLCLVKQGYILLRMLFVDSIQIFHLCRKPR